MTFILDSGQLLHFEYRAVADAPVVVFINSLGTDFRIWDDIAERFVAAGFGVLRYDKRGHGLSGLGRPPYTIGDHVQDLAALMDHLQLRHAIICGLSVGGLIAQGLCDSRPDLIRSLILCDTAHKIGTAETWNARIEIVTQEGIAAIADAVLKNWFTPAFHAGRPADLAGCRNMLTRQPREGYAGTCTALREADHAELVKRIAVPVLCLVGDQDGATPPDLVKSMADLIPGSRFEIIANAGHIPCIEQPAALFSHMLNFISAKTGGQTGG